MLKMMFFLNPMAKTCHHFAKLPHIINTIVWLVHIKFDMQNYGLIAKF